MQFAPYWVEIETSPKSGPITYPQARWVARLYAAGEGKIDVTATYTQWGAKLWAKRRARQHKKAQPQKIRKNIWI